MCVFPRKPGHDKAPQDHDHHPEADQEHADDAMTQVLGIGTYKLVGLYASAA